MTAGMFFVAAGLGFGLGLAFLIRRIRGNFVARKKAAAPVVYTSRQDARRAAREREKKQKT